jgi:hypothetical protein
MSKIMTKTTIRRYLYAAVLTLSVFSIAPALASAQNAQGTFTLTHEVRWQNATLPAGEYHFKSQPSGPAQMLVLSKVNGSPAGFMILVNDVRESVSGERLDTLVLVSRAGKSYVKEMELPEIGMTLHFDVPAAETVIAKAGTLAAATPAR